MSVPHHGTGPADFAQPRTAPAARPANPFPTDARGQASAPVLRSDSSRRLAATAKPKKRHGLYASAWALSGLVAGAYVFTLLLRQDSGALVAIRGNSVKPDLAQLQRTVGLLETDVARIRIDQAQHDEREKQLIQRVATVETRVEQFSTQVIQSQAPVAAAPAAANARVATKTPPVAPAAAAPPQQPARITTSTIPAASLPAPPAPQRELAAARQNASGSVDDSREPAAALLLARGPSLDALRLSWSLLNERHKQTLGGYQPRVVEVEPGSYQLVAGPVANPAEAMKVCASLKSRGVACQAADFKGSAL